MNSSRRSSACRSRQSASSAGSRVSGRKDDDFGDETDREFTNKLVTSAKSFLMKSSTKTGINLYEHLSDVLTRVLEERPENAADLLEQLSREQKQLRFRPGDKLRDVWPTSPQVQVADDERKLFRKSVLDEEHDEAEAGGAEVLPNVMAAADMFEKANVGLSRAEWMRIALALRKLSDDLQSAEKIRFWGKIFAINSDYYIAEVELHGDEEFPYEENQQEENNAEENPFAKDGEADEELDRNSLKEEEEEEEEGEEDEHPLPKPDPKPPLVAPDEEFRTGANRKLYYACGQLGSSWSLLPNVTAAQIVVSRKIKKFFTGNLDAEVVTFPAFPGTERNYLRAQIARIAAGTTISPQGFYAFDDDDEDDDDDAAAAAARSSFVENDEFEPPTVAELVDPSMANWVHHVQHILPQGRCTWWKPVRPDADEEEEEEEEEQEEAEEPEPEEGPPLLTPLSEDADVGGLAPWTPRISSQVLPQFAVAVMSSNLWPGSHTVARDRNFENVYIGWGHKYSGETFAPQQPDLPQQEYPSGPEITEREDPTPEEEEAVKQAEMEEEEEGEEEEEEEEEEGDYD